jgi:hypothetical protein
LIDKWLRLVEASLGVGMASGYCVIHRKPYYYPVDDQYTLGCPACVIPLLRDQAEGRLPLNYQGGPIKGEYV